MNNKPWYEKIYIWIGIIAGIFAILGLSVFDNKSLFKNSGINNEQIDHESDEKHGDDIDIEGNKNIIITGDVEGDVNINANAEAESNTNSNLLEAETTPQFNFGQAMQYIFNNEEIIKNEIIYNEENNPIYSSLYSGVSYFYISDKVYLIEVTKGFRNILCSRTYYFDEQGELTFALMCDNEGEHRLYFYDDILIRYKDVNGVDYDLNFDLDHCECKWAELALEESYEIYSGIQKHTKENDFYVEASYDMDTKQNSTSGIDVLVKAKTSFPANHVTISAVPDEGEIRTFDMHGGVYEWYFKANFYIKGTYTIIITAYNSEEESVSDEFTYVY